MRCTRIREAISARLDREDLGLPAEQVDAHLSECADCRTWASAAESLEGTTQRQPAPHSAPDQAVLTKLTSHPAAREPSSGHLISTFEWRFLLAVSAIAQIVLGWPGVVLHDGHASVHLAHELTGWDMGLAVGLLFVAWRPARAWGMLPLVAFLVACMVLTSAVDLAAGNALLGREAVHALAVFGLGCLSVIARRSPRPSIVVRIA